MKPFSIILGMVWLALMIGCGSNVTQIAILRVLKEHKAAEAAFAQITILDKNWNAGPIFWQYTNRIDSIDLTGCPKDFQAAYKRHVLA
jgi:hypothetical protein